MSDSREDSPDWLRSFQAPPTHSVLSLSSDSDSQLNGDVKVANEVESDKRMEPLEPNSSNWAISSDSESCPDRTLVEEKLFHLEEKVKGEDGAQIVREKKSPIKKAAKVKSPKKGQKVSRSVKKEKSLDDNFKKEGLDGDEVMEEDKAEKHSERHVSTSSLPLVLSEKVQRTKALVECEGESIDLSGDMGSVGRVIIPDTAKGDDEMYLDLKGTIYKTAIVPSRTFCVVSFGQSEAKIEAIMNDFIQLKPQSNVYEAETMVEGTLEGFSFDSEDEGDKNIKVTSHQIDQNDGTEEHTNGKGKAKAKAKAKAEKPSGTGRKRGKTTGGKPQPAKKVRKKSQVTKKAKAKK